MKKTLVLTYGSEQAAIDCTGSIHYGTYVAGQGWIKTDCPSGMMIVLAETLRDKAIKMDA